MNNSLIKITELIRNTAERYAVAPYSSRDGFDALTALCESAEKLAVYAREEWRDYPSPEDDNEERFAGAEEEPVSLRPVCEGVWCLRVPPLLPKSKVSRQGISAGKWYSAMYGARLARLLEEVDLGEGPFVLWYRHVYRSLHSRHVKDFDNLETKALTDLITKRLGKDDHPSMFACYVDAVEGEGDYCDIYIMPKERFFDFITRTEGG